MNTATNMNNKRYPWLAAFLSLIMPGLGQLYCGAIIKCLWLAGLISAIGLLGLVAVIPGFPVNEYLVILFLALSVLLYGFGVVDAFFTACRVREDYKLKDYNRWYAYALLCVVVSGGNLFSGLYVRDRLLQPFQVPTAAMYPAIWPGDKVLAAKN